MKEDSLAIKLSYIVHGQCKDGVPHDIGLTLASVAEKHISKGFTFASKAIEVGRQVTKNEIIVEVGCWTDGIGVYSDNVFPEEYQPKKGKTYRVTIEEIKE